VAETWAWRRAAARLCARLLDPFRTGAGVDLWLVLAFVAINTIVLINALRHDPLIGYDAPGHLRYIQALAGGSLPTVDQTGEFFSPPLPYVIGACATAWWGASVAEAGKAAQLFQVLVSLLTTYSLLALGREMGPGEGRTRLYALVLLGMLPVYYKSFAMVRGEPYVALMAVLAALLWLRLTTSVWRWERDAVVLGVVLGLAALSRQWAFMLFPALLVHGALVASKDRSRWCRHLAALAVACVVAAVVGGWFYLSLLARHGTIMAFNRPGAPSFSLRNQPVSFYLGTGNGKLFRDPLRPSFPNQLVPQLYSETWGDYGGYFIWWGRRSADGGLLTGKRVARLLERHPAPAWLRTNRDTIGPFLGRVNLVSLLPSALGLAGLAMGCISLLRFTIRRVPAPEDGHHALLVLMVGAFLAGYLWFLIMHPSPGAGDTIKATYVLHAFPLLAMLAAGFLDRVRVRSRMAQRLVLVGIGLVLLHNLPALFSRFVPG